MTPVLVGFLALVAVLGSMVFPDSTAGAPLIPGVPSDIGGGALLPPIGEGDVNVSDVSLNGVSIGPGTIGTTSGIPQPGERMTPLPGDTSYGPADYGLPRPPAPIR